MALTPKLLLRQSQSLVMTPQLMQAIKLLQLSSLIGLATDRGLAYAGRRIVHWEGRR